MLVGFPASRILSRLYYEDGGTSIWLLAWTAVAGWPLTALALLPFFMKRGTVPTRLTWGLLMAYTVLGLLTAVDNLLYSWAYCYLPASTASLISASSLPFTAIFAYFLLGKKVTASIFNAIGIITAAAAILALDSSSDMPLGVSSKQYALGFLLDVAGSALHGLIFTLSELIFVKYLGRESTHVILEQQAMVSIVGFAFTTIGVIASGDYAVITLEADAFTLGSFGYYMVLVWSTITLQVGILGSVAVMYSASAVLAGVLNAVVVPVTSIGAVLFVNDSIDGFKIVSLLLTGWGFGSYIYGGLNEAPSVTPADLSEPLYKNMVNVSVSDHDEIENVHQNHH
ncbi:hypothetical protein GOP47_0010397 [Adiantum capillus-veneris]|nr:hypothetical protein GOP47_0010397 [Adiantum capillus-veneris]